MYVSPAEDLWTPLESAGVRTVHTAPALTVVSAVRSLVHYPHGVGLESEGLGVVRPPPMAVTELHRRPLRLGSRPST